MYETTRGDNLSDGVYYFAIEDFENAYKVYSDLSLKDSTNTYIKIYLGLSAMEIDKDKIAEECFIFIISDNDSLFIDVAYWYLSMLYLKDKDYDKAIPILKKIHRNNGYKSDESLIILNKIEELG